MQRFAGSLHEIYAVNLSIQIMSFGSTPNAAKGLLLKMLPPGKQQDSARLGLWTSKLPKDLKTS